FAVLLFFFFKLSEEGILFLYTFLIGFHLFFVGCFTASVGNCAAKGGNCRFTCIISGRACTFDCKGSSRSPVLGCVVYISRSGADFLHIRMFFYTVPFIEKGDEYDRQQC